ncbi:putative lipid-transfer protein DIR1 [Trifolium pratense]|nr:putative lipid-transfer protein DIR1 [Trifolium pratense]
MEAYKKVMIVVMLLAFANVTMLVNGQTFCRTTKAGRDACKPYVNGDNSVDNQNPSSACCSAIAKADLPCLCQYKNYLPLYGIDPEQVMQLPVNCKLTNSFHC